MAEVSLKILNSGITLKNSPRRALPVVCNQHKKVISCRIKFLVFLQFIWGSRNLLCFSTMREVTLTFSNAIVYTVPLSGRCSNINELSMAGLCKLNTDSLQSIILNLIPHLCTHEPQRENTCLRGFANNKGPDQTAHSRSLISTFIIRLLESSISKLITSEISIL